MKILSEGLVPLPGGDVATKIDCHRCHCVFAAFKEEFEVTRVPRHNGPFGPFALVDEVWVINCPQCKLCLVTRRDANE